LVAPRAGNPGPWAENEFFKCFHCMRNNRRCSPQ
jgi:hypothetical protein